MLNEEYNVKFPIEAFIEWVKDRAIGYEIITERTDVSVNNITYDEVNGWLIVNGDFSTKSLDS
jgi:hypothetical protein